MYFLSNNSEHVTNVGSLRYSIGITVGISLFMTLFSLSILILNILVVITYIKIKGLQITRNYFILSLAVCDITIALVPVNSYTVYLVYGYWPLGHTTCNLFLIFSYSVCTASTLTLLTIAFDRFMAVYFPIVHRFNYTKRKVILVTILIWLMAFLIWTPAIIVYKKHNGDECYVHFLESNWKLSLGTAFVSYYGPFLLTIISYFCISRKLVTRHNIIYRHVSNIYKGVKKTSCAQVSENQELQEQENNEEQPQEIINDSNDHFQIQISAILNAVLLSKETGKTHKNNNRSESVHLFKGTYVPEKSKQRGIKNHKRSLKVFLLVIIAFGIAWLPYHIMLAITSTGNKVPVPYWNFAYIFGWANSLFNPFCYAFGNRNFNRAFKVVFFNKKKEDRLLHLLNTARNL